MRILHTSDWHLGKSLKGLSLIDDQAFILKEFLSIVDDYKPDAVLICGDIYDKNNPSPEAIELFDETLYKFYERKLKVLCISGNHDNSIRLNFGSRLFANNKIFLVTKISENPSIITFEDEFGEVCFSLIPHFEVNEFNRIFNINKQLTHDIISKEYLNFVRQKISNNKRSVILAHVFVDGAIESESEKKNCRRF